MAQTPEERVSGVLRLTVGGVEKDVPTLPIRYVLEWQRKLTAVSGGFGLPKLRDWVTATAGEFANLTTETLVELAIAYDRNGALGGREWLEEHADPAELYAAVSAMAENAFPFAEDGRALLATMIAQATLADEMSDQGNSTSGPSPIGDSTPASSRKPSTRSS